MVAAAADEHSGQALAQTPTLHQEAVIDGNNAARRGSAFQQVSPGSSLRRRAGTRVPLAAQYTQYILNIQWF